MEENKENKSPKTKRLQRLKIGSVVPRLTPAKNNIGKRPSLVDKISKEQSDLNVESEAEDKDFSEEIVLERKEQMTMQTHGFYSNAAVCLPSWEDGSQLTLRQLEADEIGIAIDGESYMKRQYGGSGFSDIFPTKGEQAFSNRKRPRTSLDSSDEGVAEDDCQKPQTEDNQWVVEKILSMRIFMQSGQKITQYYFKWKGWNYKQSTWEIHSDANSIDDLIHTYNKRLKWREAICRRVPAPERLYFHNNYMLNSLLHCQQWEDEMNVVIKSCSLKLAPIYVENWVDEEAKPKKFQFILENRFSNETEKELQGIPNVEHCKCVENDGECGSQMDCCPYNFNQNYCYLEDGRLDLRQTSMSKNWIVECTDACKCDINCPTRVVQRGRQIPIVIFRTLDRGWAVRTCVEIKRREFVCEYVGEVLTDEESLKSKNPSTYQFQMDGCGPKYSFIVDAANFGNEARFVNHSCWPNLVVFPVFADRLDQRYHRIAFFAKRDIKQGDELTIDYMAMDQFANGRRQKPCNCKSKKCRGFFYY